MILFQKDWLKHPQAKIHYSTRNKSFLRLAKVLHGLGVKNNAFHLSLLNPELEYVDPFAEDLTDVQMIMVLEECMNNFWYFVREIMRVSSADGRLGGVPFRINRSNLAVYWLYLNHITVINTVIRQVGKTTSLKALYNWLLGFGLSGGVIGLITKDSGLKIETMAEIKDQFELLPGYLNMAQKSDIMNGDIIELKRTNNKLMGWISNTSPVGAAKVARGFPVGTTAWDEIAYIPNIEIAMSSATFSGNAARPALAEAGLPYGTVMFTTVGDRENRDGRFVYNMINNSTYFTDNFYDAEDIDHLEELITANTQARDIKEALPLVTVSYSYRQMGFSDEWMKERLKENALSSKTAINRDLYNRWVASNSETPLEEDEIERLKEGEVDNHRNELQEPFNYNLRWFIGEEEVEARRASGHSIIVGIDTSNGVKRDDIAFKGRDSVTGEIVCTGTFNDTNLVTISNFFAHFLIKHTNAMYVIENKSSAQGIIDQLILILSANGINPYKRLYNTIFQDPIKYKKEYNELKSSRPDNVDLFNKYRDKIGFVTSGHGITSRDGLFSTVMRNCLKFTAHLTRDKVTISQFLGLVYKNGRVDHAEGGHDDLVIATLLSYWLIMFGTNLHMYGIDPRTILKKNDVYLNEKFEINGSIHKQREAEKRERELNRVIEQIREETNPVIIAQLERQLTFLYRDIKTVGNYVNVEDLISDLRKEKSIQRRIG